MWQASGEEPPLIDYTALLDVTDVVKPTMLPHEVDAQSMPTTAYHMRRIHRIHHTCRR